VAAYQLAHAGELPSERQTNLQQLQNLQMQMNANAESMNRDRDQRMLVERSLADLVLEAQLAPAPGAVPAPSADPMSVGTGSAAAQLEAARNNLRALELRGYTPDHPDVQVMKRRIKALEAKVEAEAMEKPLSETAVPTHAATPEEAARATRMADLQAQIANIDIQLKSKQAEDKRLRGVIAGYEAHVAATPLREAEMIALTRDYTTVQTNYNSLLAKQEDSKVAANLEQRAIGEQFRILDQARPPERPFSPNRLYINFAGALAGLGLGVGIVGLLEYKDRSFRSEDDVVLCLSLPVLAVVPVMTTRVERRRAKRRRVLLWCAAAVFFVVGITGAVAWKLGWLGSLLQ
jgi:uncharacterized protein involved in exopolysaccharide biosynthesis